MFKSESRSELATARNTRDYKLHDILTNPASAFQAFRAAGRTSAPTVRRMHVGDKVYNGDCVADGMFDSLNTLKAPSMDDYDTLPPYNEAVETYNHIIKLASNGGQIPPLSLSDGEKLLRSLKSSVLNGYSITSLHFLHLGKEGVFHFVFLLNTIIEHIGCWLGRFSDRGGRLAETCHGEMMPDLFFYRDPEEAEKDER